MRDARPEPRLTVLTGPSGAGKGSVIELVRARSPWVWISVTATTRPPRRYEVDGVDRVFLARSRFEELIATGGMLEWTELGGHLYGTPSAPVWARLRDGRPVLVELDPQGAAQVRAAVPRARLVRLVPPSAAPAADGTRDGDGFDATVVNDRAERAAEELVKLLGSCALAPTRPGVRG